MTDKSKVEASIHKAVCDFAQAVFNEHGVQLHEVSIAWWDLKNPTKADAIVVSVQLQTKSFPQQSP